MGNTTHDATAEPIPTPRPGKPMPVVYTDFDGVLNAFPDYTVLRRGGVNRTPLWLRPDDPRAAIYSPQHAFHLDGNEQARTPIGRFRIHFSRELSDAIMASAAAGAINLSWLSTWQPYCDDILDPLLDWNPATVGTILWYDPVTNEHRRTGKLEAVVSRLRFENRGADPAPLVWIDDEECTPHAADTLRGLAPRSRVLMVRPDERIGISRRQWRLIHDFCAGEPIDGLVARPADDNPEGNAAAGGSAANDGMPQVVLDEEPGLIRREGHLGL